MLYLIKGGAGTGKSHMIMELIKKSAEENRRTIVIIPEQFDFEYNRMLYNFMGMKSFNKIETCGFSRLAKQIFIKHGGLKGKYADDTIMRTAMFCALSKLSKEKSLLFFERQVNQPSFIDDALEYVKAFASNSISPEQLIEKLPLMRDGLKDKIHDIALIYSEYTHFLSEYGCKDNLTDVSAASEKAAANSFFDGANVYIDEFKSFTADEYQMISAVLSSAASLTVCLTTCDKVPVRYSLFDTANSASAKLINIAAENGVSVKTEFFTENHRFKYPELEFLSRHIMRSEKAVFDKKCDAVNIIEATEPYEEADYIGAEIRHLVQKGYKYSDIVVLARNKEDYSSILDAAFERNGIPFYSDEKESVTHKALFIFIQTALHITASKKPSSEDFLRYIKTGFANLDINETEALEAYCYKWSVEGDMWKREFRIETEADKFAEKARIKVITPLENLRQKTLDASAEDICRAVFDFIDETHTCDALSKYIETASRSEPDIIYAAREAKQLWEMLCKLLQTLYSVLGGTKLTLNDFCSIFETAASGLSLSAPPQTLDAVNFSSTHMARLANPKIIFVIGANEGILPYAVKSSPLLSDRDIDALHQNGIEISGKASDKLAEERHAAYAAVSGASEKLYITYPIADVSGKALYPSLCVNQANDMLGNITKTVSSFGLLYLCTTEQSGYYQYVQNYKRQDVDSASLREALKRFSPLNKEKFAYLDSIDTTNGHKKRISRQITDRLYGKKMDISVSRLDDYKRCPFIYFCKKGLKIYPRKKIDLNELERGNIVHFCLCSILSQYNKDAFAALSQKDMKEAIASALSAYLLTLGGSYGKTKRFEAAYARLSDTLADILIRIQKEFSQSEFYPADFEYKLSGKTALLTLSDGTEVFLGGSIDRIDTFKNDNKTYIRVIDYKTGKKVLSYDDLYYGINMQMLIYIFAVTNSNMGEKYAGSLPVGVLYMPARDIEPLETRNTANDDLEEKAQNQTYRMSGIVLHDLKMIEAMEKDCGGHFIPAKIKIDGTPDKYSRLITQSEINNLRKYSDELIKETAEGIKSGIVEANPLNKTVRNGSPCTHCDYKSVCGNYPNIISRKYEPDAAVKMAEKLKEGI